MTALVLKDCTIWADQYDLTSDVNGVESDWSCDEVECTTYASGGNRERKSGLATSKIELKTFMDFSLSEPVLHALKGTTGHIVTVTPTGAAHDRCHFARALGGSLKRGQKLGDMALLDGSFTTTSTEGLLEGYLLLPKTTAGATSTGTIYNDTAVGSTQSVYGALHVFAASGSTPTLDVIVQSAALVGFGSPTDRLTFTTATDVTSEFKSAAGAITDAFWRVKYTIGGSTPSFTFAVAYAVQ